MLVIGTRPEAVKLAPVARAMALSPFFDPVVVSTGQHREMLQQMLGLLEMRVHAQLDVMRASQELSALTAQLICGLGEVMRKVRPQLVVVQGDTTSALAGALTAFYEHIPVVHVEAGLRSGVPNSPFPEELNRRLISRVACRHFAPTPGAAAHLVAEGVPAAEVTVTGNTVVDNLMWVLRKGTGQSLFSSNRRRILVTLHRRESLGGPMRAMGQAVRRLADRGDVEVVIPLHKNPAVREALLPQLSRHPCITVTEPMGYRDFCASLAACDLVLTDSGGIQEEAPSLGKPVLVLRSHTERLEAVEAGAARLVGTDPEAIVTETARLLDDGALYKRMSTAGNPFGDGQAASRILDRLANDFGRHALPHRSDGADPPMSTTLRKEDA
ncbi:non-hydrolyzing UDP-N-acetylglucosamine 2-epimerase [Streptomyces syringium]|uniref:non-hydrolyzing UDP-N-acetylglucosamine 2-epimerase n=1 Tax=Streptomyces syringium TaxID=76729 RepID=UPI0034475B6C